jgi:hypothetical protein
MTDLELLNQVDSALMRVERARRPYVVVRFTDAAWLVVVEYLRVGRDSGPVRHTTGALMVPPGFSFDTPERPYREVWRDAAGFTIAVAT